MTIIPDNLPVYVLPEHLNVLREAVPSINWQPLEDIEARRQWERRKMLRRLLNQRKTNRRWNNRFGLRR